jgi:hypothetical protein
MGPTYASASGISWVRFGQDDRKIDVMQPYLDRQAATGRSGVGVAQEFSGSGLPTSGTRRLRCRNTPLPRLTAG